MSSKNVFIFQFIWLTAFNSCSSPEEVDFSYVQDFSPHSSEVKNQTTRLVFEDVREEGWLSSWHKANWMLADNGVRVVGSRKAEVERREKLVKDVYQGHESFVTIRGFRVHWLTLSMGDLTWRDYTVSTTVMLEKGTNAGMAFRYLNSREYYAMVLDENNDVTRLVLRRMDKEAKVDRPAWDELKSADYLLFPDKEYKIQAEVRGDQIICSIDDSTVIEFRDTYREIGKVALIADDPVLFGPVLAQGKKKITEPKRDIQYDKPELVYEFPLSGGDIDRRFWFLDPDSDGEKEMIIADRNEDNYSYRCFEFNGTELWRIDNIEYTEGADFTAMQVFDINGDGKNEMITAINFQIQVREGKTGILLESVSTPDQNPYYDSRDYPYPKLLGAALCPVKINPNKPPGFYIKDRYTNIWLYDNNLNQLWHKAMSTAHFPLPVDIDADGIDEIMVNHKMLKADGSVIWELLLSDHSDNIGYVSLNPGKEPEYFYIAGGEMGLLKVDPSNGETLNRFELGHIQTITIADFLPEKEGLELLTQTAWREDQIHYLYDKDLILVSTWQGDFGQIYPIPWGQNGSDLVLISTEENFRIVYPLTGEVLYISPGQAVGVFADRRLGNVLVAAEEENHLKIYASPNDSNLEPIKFSFSEIQSDYLPVIKTTLYE